MKVIYDIVADTLDNTTDDCFRYTRELIVATRDSLSCLIMFCLMIPLFFYRIYTKIMVINRDKKYFHELLNDIKTGYPKNSRVVKLAIKGKIDTYPNVRMYKTLLKAYNHYVTDL